MKQSPEINLKKNQQRLNDLLRELENQCVNVSDPKGILEHVQYFCGESGTIEDLNVRADERLALYKNIASLLCVYIKVSDQFTSAAFAQHYIEYIDKRIDFYIMLRELIRCNVQLIHLAPGLNLYDSTLLLFSDYLYLIKKIQKQKHSPMGIRYINSRLDHYIKLREIICLDARSLTDD